MPLRMETPLDRDLLQVTDGSVSRAENAPKLRPGGSGIELFVPKHSARRVLVLTSTRFDTLQYGVPPLALPWKVSPGQLQRVHRLVVTPEAAFALVRSMRWDETDLPDHLLELPQARWVGAGEVLRLALPALLVIGEGAIELTPSSTVVPEAPPKTLAGVRSFKLPSLALSVEAVRQLDAFWDHERAAILRVAGLDGEFAKSELAKAGEVLLDKLQRRQVFAPISLRTSEPRLALFYRRFDDSTGALLSSADLGEWLQDVSEAVALAKSDPDRDVCERRAADRVSVRPPPLPSLAEPTGIGAAWTLNARFAAVLENLAQVAPTELGVLLLGASGTGKGHLVRVIHQASARSKGPLVALNCAAIPENLIESELFGHQRGAFTGAEGARDGAFVAAHGGTLFLDEIGDAPLRVQLALLRALESRSVKPVGSDRERVVDVRVIAATSRNLDEFITNERFRKDLYYRLAGSVVNLPALCERLEDLPLLCQALLEALPGAPELSPGALRRLQEHTWPGNIRELAHALERAVALSGGAALLEAHHFDLAPQLGRGGLVSGIPIQFPEHIIELAERTWTAGALQPLNIASSHEQRAHQRAILLCASTQHDRRTFPAELSQQWSRLFSTKWASSEGGRGLKELLRVMKLDPRDATAREWVVGWVG